MRRPRTVTRQNRQNILDEIETLLQSELIDISQASSSADNDIYEAYIFFLVIEAARRENAEIGYVNFNGEASTELIFRTSPGVIYSRINNYTHAVLNFGSNIPILEVHIGIKLVGKSKVEHEADVVVLYSEAAHKCRRSHYSPISSKAILSVECKYYSTKLKLDLARSFIGLVQDLSVKEAFFVSNTNSNSVQKLLSIRVKNWERDILPSSNRETERLTNSFQTIFKNYVAEKS